jgi:hypothetical protein
MKILWSKIIANFYIQILIFIIINAIFIFKYMPRYDINPFIVFLGYTVFLFLGLWIYRKFSKLLSEILLKYIYFSIISLTVALIAISLILIDPYTIRVDRWSALSFFWDSVFAGIYPYGTHTHVSDTNFASPFPIWHLINLPFYLLKDVGISIIFFLCLFSYAIYNYFESYRKALLVIILLLVSPAYWWEILVRSDGLSNALLVMMIILWYSKNNKSLSNNLFVSILICGFIAATRFTAILPLALFYFQPYLKLPIKQKIIFPISALSIAIFAFLPFIFWDTENWVFFSRNPFMSQTYNGDFRIMLMMVFIGIVMSLNWKTIEQFFATASIFIFLFILLNQLVRLSHFPEANFFSDSVVDVSYFTLALPYSILLLSSKYSTPK